jgi:hypothetical protein
MIKPITALMIVGFASTQEQATPVGMDFSQFGSFVEGMISGFFEKQMPNIENCLGQSETIVHDVEQSVTDFGTGTAEGIGQGFIDIGMAIKAIPAATKGCEDIIDVDVASFGKLGDTFANFTSLSYTVGENLLLNGHEIGVEWSAAMAAEAKGDYFTYGEKLGIALDECIQPIQPWGTGKDLVPAPVGSTDTFGNVMETIGGLFVGFFGKQMPKFEDCVEKSDDELNLLIKAVDDFSTGSYESIANGFHDIGDFVSGIPKLVSGCPKVTEDIDSFTELGKTFSDFGTFSYTVGENLAINGHEIFAEWDSAMAAEAKGDYFMFGVNMGIALDECIQPDPLGEESALFLQ